MTKEEIDILRTIMREELDQMREELAQTEHKILAQVEKQVHDSQESSRKFFTTLIDTEVKPEFNLLAEGQEAIIQRLPDQDEAEVVDTRVSALEMMVNKLNKNLRDLNHEVQKLKKAQ